MNRQGRNQYTKKVGVGAPTNQTMGEAAAAAGLSKTRIIEAIRVASIPLDEFEAMIEAPQPPTLAVLAEYGRRVRNGECPNPHTGQALVLELACAGREIENLMIMIGASKFAELVDDLDPNHRDSIARGCSTIRKLCAAVAGR